MGYNPQKLFIRFYKSITWRAPYQYLVETCVPNADRVRRPAPKQRHGPQRLPPGAASGRHKGAQVEGVEAKGGGGQGLEAEKWGLGQEIFYIFLGGCSREFWWFSSGFLGISRYNNMGKSQKNPAFMGKLVCFVEMMGQKRWNLLRRFWWETHGNIWHNRIFVSLANDLSGVCMIPWWNLSEKYGFPNKRHPLDSR